LLANGCETLAMAEMDDRLKDDPEADDYQDDDLVCDAVWMRKSGHPTVSTFWSMNAVFPDTGRKDDSVSRLYCDLVHPCKDALISCLDLRESDIDGAQVLDADAPRV
jgi:hypothetical protein